MKKEKLIKKQPVVVIVGHIDHGKTSILDYIRKSHVAEKEIGGITQHTGAYEIEKDGRGITFIDTPGHEAFSAMRARGAKVADLAVLVVAADEGVESQTKEAILHIKKAKIPMIVAINKVDKPSSQPERVKDGLSKEDVLVEDRGGKVPSIAVSAKTGKGVSDLLDLILLVTEMENLGADVSVPAQGVIIESLLDARRGPVATLLLEKGILKKGSFLGTPSSFGKTKRIENFQGREIEEVLPGQPALILGFEKVPVIGESFGAFLSLEEAKGEIEKKEEIPGPSTLGTSEKKILNLILKTDVLGSIEPIEEVLKSIPQESIFLRILKKDVGDVNLSDIKLAETGKAIVLGFRVKVPSPITEIARRKSVRILSFELIYDLVEGMRTFIEKISTPKIERIDLGRLKTLAIFRTERRRQIVGARVLEGEIRQGVRLEVFREDEKIGGGKVVELQMNKKEIGKGVKGDEVGILYEGDAKIQEDDILVVYEEKRQKIEKG